MQQLFWHSPCAASCTVNPSFQKVTLYNTFPITHHTRPFLFTLSHLQPSCLYKAASCSHIHTPRRHAVRGCRPLFSPPPSQSEWEKFTLAFSFFLDVLCGSCYGDGIQRQLWQPVYTRVGRSLSLCLQMCVPVCNAPDLSPISWIWCVFYCLLKKRLIKRLCVIGLVDSLNKLLIFSFITIFLSVTHTSSHTAWFSNHHDILTLHQIKESKLYV